jgi:hypothetical protein
MMRNLRPAESGSKASRRLLPLAFSMKAIPESFTPILIGEGKGGFCSTMKLKNQK